MSSGSGFRRYTAVTRVRCHSSGGIPAVYDAFSRILARAPVDLSSTGFASGSSTLVWERDGSAWSARVYLAYRPSYGYEPYYLGRASGWPEDGITARAGETVEVSWVKPDPKPVVVVRPDAWATDPLFLSGDLSEMSMISEMSMSYQIKAWRPL